MTAAPRTDVPRIIGHRGAVGHAPENTLPGLHAAKALGCSWVEFDCMLTRDGVVILHHDDTLDRTTSGTGPVAETDYKAIQGLDAGAWFGPAFVGACVPTLGQAIGACAKLGLGANVEIKPTEGRARETGRLVARETAALWPAHLPPPVLSSFSLDALAAAAEEAPQIDRAALWWEIPEDWADHHARLGVSAAHVSWKKTSNAEARAFTRAGVPFRAYTVNEAEVAERLFTLGCETIFTDYPERFLPAL